MLGQGVADGAWRYNMAWTPAGRAGRDAHKHEGTGSEWQPLSSPTHYPPLKLLLRSTAAATGD